MLLTGELVPANRARELGLINRVVPAAELHASTFALAAQIAAQSAPAAAVEEVIRAAYRKLAKKPHPDVNPDKPDAATRFGEISSAYDLVSDKDKRGKFDRGEIDAEGHEVHQQRQYYRDAPGHERYDTAGAGFSQEDLEAFLNQAFGRAGQHSDWGATGRPMRGRDMQS